jgi:hypothetical protein
MTVVNDMGPEVEKKRHRRNRKLLGDECKRLCGGNGRGGGTRSGTFSSRQKSMKWLEPRENLGSVELFFIHKFNPYSSAGGI